MNLLSRFSAKVNAYRNIPRSVSELHHSVKRFLPKNPILIEAGSHMGYDTLGLSKIWPLGFIYGFEPIPALYEALSERIKLQKNVKIYNLALGEADTTVEMYVSDGQSSASSSVLKPTKHIDLFPGVSFTDKISVKMIKIQTWAQAEGVKSIDLMWLDMQGYEVKALRGMADLLNGVKVIYTELCRDELYQGLVTREAYIHFLETKGFELISKLNENDLVSDGIFVNRKVKR
jgi:FkbM family methyltransferase